MASCCDEARAVTLCSPSFSLCDVPDSRLRHRLSLIYSAVEASGGGSLPEMLGRGAPLKAAYRLFSNSRVAPGDIQSAHRNDVLERAQKSSVLFLEDTTTMVFNDHGARRGLGLINGTCTEGFLLHSALAVEAPCITAEPGQRRPPLGLIGLAHQEHYIRVPRPEEEKKSKAGTKMAKARARESDLWRRSSKALGRAPRGVTWTRVDDRGADIFEVLADYLSLGHDFCVRAAQDRSLAGGGRLMETMRRAEPVASHSLELRARPGQAARTAHVALSSVRVRLLAPKRPASARTEEPELPASIGCLAVRVFEPGPPPGVTSPLEWILLCGDEENPAPERLLERLGQYSCRWLIEEFHKALKSGLGAEDLQLESFGALSAATALLSLVALTLLDLKESARLWPDADALEYGPYTQEALLLLATVAKSKTPIRTLRDLTLALGALGGHQGRKGDGMPGWQTLQRGESRLRDMLIGASLVREIRLTK